MTENQVIVLYKEELRDKAAQKGPLLPFTLSLVVLLFTSLDYWILNLHSINYRLIAIIPMIFAACVNLFYPNMKKLILIAHNLWVTGGNLMMAGLCFLVFSEYGDNLVLKYGTIVGYSIVIYISILVSIDKHIIWYILIPLILASISIASLISLEESVILINLYVVVIVGIILIKNQFSQSYDQFKDKIFIQDLNKKLQEFAHIASHDMRSPLGIISNHIDRIENRLDKEDIKAAKALFPRIRETIDHLDKLTLDILSYSSENKEEESWVDISELIEDIKKSVFELHEGKIYFSMSPDLPQIYASKTKLYQILHNLISNSLKYRSPDRLLELEIQSSEKAQQFILAISDNGQGIPNAFQDRIFEPFKRAQTRIPGSGLGLSIVKKHIESLGGYISFDSQLGRGSTFYLHFPIDKVII